MTGIPEHRIEDYDSFQSITSEPNQIAGLYFFSTLDCLVDMATWVAHDFFDRPHLYTDLDQPAKSEAGSASLASVLAALHAREGSDERFLSRAQRRQIYTALFGPSPHTMIDADSDFERLQRELVNACAAFAERVFDTSVDMLRERVRTTHRPFKEYLTGLQGSSVRWSREEALAILTEQVAYRILRNRGVAAIFGIAQRPATAWPYVDDSNGDKLVQEIWRQLMPSADMALIARGEPYPVPLTRERFSNLQRAASTGTVAIRTVLDLREDGTNDDLDRLITTCYTWGSALMGLETPVAAEQPVPEPTRDGALVGTAVVETGSPTDGHVYTP
jgi:hypothetical protein